METERLLITLVAALAINELIHILFEVWGMRQKVIWLKARLDKKPHGNWPINIDSLTKTVILHFVLFCLIVGLTFSGLTILALPTPALLKLSVIVLVVVYAYTVFGLNACHTEIDQIIHRYKRYIKTK